ncbi:hypothetical protein [Methanosarcina sp. 1.H.A.2.2]|uniref:hypothetical protein n=1 Tax=Methanosarcina sp. 1.H.A.2.2 TaxID=1483601 RepID=UPI00062241F4|nr:hypothetical protein [Methanosarcina sp. 1.H.A.2.2]KKH45968.1 hypothetical protein EO93_06910 [Methanosarcina sp. 1.H.A.2.2]
MREHFGCFFQMANAKGSKVLIVGNKCYRCGHEWLPTGDTPRVCPRCKSPYWDRPRKSETDSEDNEFEDVVGKVFERLEKVIKNHKDDMSEEDISYELQKMVGDLSPEEQMLLKKKLLEERK